MIINSILLLGSLHNEINNNEQIKLFRTNNGGSEFGIFRIFPKLESIFMKGGGVKMCKNIG